ncbi:MAG: two-component system sensor histidine kinase NtrB [Gammaproteobacteria bacterium]|nr:MAG: two-component system sensor histidine kinase NtrB [Gammaproteobacteria bacterium]
MNNLSFSTDKIINQLLSAVLVVNRDLTIAWSNPASEELLGLSQRQLRDSHLSDVIIDADYSVKVIAYSLRSGNHYHQRDTKMTLINHEEFMADISVSSIELEGEQKLLVEIKQTGREHRIGLESSEYSQHLAANALVQGLGHEIKNPLGGLRGAAQLLAMELVEPELKEYTDIIIKEADRLSALVDRMMAPHQQGKKQLVNIHQLIELVLNLLTLEAGEKLHLERDYDPSLPDLFVCGDQIQQAMLNLMQNAIQAMEGEGTLTLKTRIVGPMLLGDQIYRLVQRLDISDDGPGVPVELRKKIFMPLISGRQGGTGLGLGIAQSLIQQHQGLIEYQDKHERTTFTLYLPVISQTNNETQGVDL